MIIFFCEFLGDPSLPPLHGLRSWSALLLEGIDDDISSLGALWETEKGVSDSRGSSVRGVALDRALTFHSSKLEGSQRLSANPSNAFCPYFFKKYSLERPGQVLESGRGPL